jgi:hypothetical protein
VVTTVEAGRIIRLETYRTVFAGIRANVATYNAPQNHSGNVLDGLLACVSYPRHHPAQARRLAGTSEHSLPRIGAYSFQRRHQWRDMLDRILVHSSHQKAGAYLHGGDVCEHSALACKNVIASLGCCNQACRRIRVGRRNACSIGTTIGLLESGRARPRKRRRVALNCRNIPITLIDPTKG